MFSLKSCLLAATFFFFFVVAENWRISSPLWCNYKLSAVLLLFECFGTCRSWPQTWCRMIQIFVVRLLFQGLGTVDGHMTTSLLPFYTQPCIFADLVNGSLQCAKDWLARQILALGLYKATYLCQTCYIYLFRRCRVVEYGGRNRLQLPPIALWKVETWFTEMDFSTPIWEWNRKKKLYIFKTNLTSLSLLNKWCRSMNLM